MKQPASGGGRTSGLPAILKVEAGAVLGRPFGVLFWLGTASRMALSIYACAGRLQGHV